MRLDTYMVPQAQTKAGSKHNTQNELPVWKLAIWTIRLIFLSGYSHCFSSRTLSLTQAQKSVLGKRMCDLPLLFTLHLFLFSYQGQREMVIHMSLQTFGGSLETPMLSLFSGKEMQPLGDLILSACHCTQEDDHMVLWCKSNPFSFLGVHSGLRKLLSHSSH